MIQLYLRVLYGSRGVVLGRASLSHCQHSVSLRMRGCTGTFRSLCTSNIKISSYHIKISSYHIPITYMNVEI
jgi:hypothetical protein